MAKWIRYTPEQEKLWETWVAERPECIRKMIKDHNLRGDVVYLYKPTGQHFILHSFEENGTVTANLLDRFNQHLEIHRMMPGMHEVRVFGMDPAGFEECDYDGPVDGGPEA